MDTLVLQISEELHSQILDLPSEHLLKQWILQVLESERQQNSLLSKIYEVTIRIVSSEESQQLNITYRHKNKPTNVLSFMSELPSFIEMDPMPLGDLVICYDVIQQESKDQNKASQDHWAHMVIHGCLHLLGYDHQTDLEANIMEEKEIKLLGDIGIKNPYIEIP